MKKLLFLPFILLSCILAGCGSSQEPVESVALPIETLTIATEEHIIETVSPDSSAPAENKILLDLDGDGQEETLIYQDGRLRKILLQDSGEERIVMEDSAIFLCDDQQTILRFSEGSGGHTWFYYGLENGEMVPLECLVYHWGDNCYFRSTDFSAQDNSLEELTEEEYHQAMAVFPCAEAENSFLGDLFR